MVLASVNLGLFVSLWFLAVAAFLGAGLTFAGAPEPVAWPSCS
jgi:hypothetical protein